MDHTICVSKDKVSTDQVMGGCDTQTEGHKQSQLLPSQIMLAGTNSQLGAISIQKCAHKCGRRREVPEDQGSHESMQQDVAGMENHRVWGPSASKDPSACMP